MKDFSTTQQIYEYLIAGGKIKVRGSDETYYLHIINGNLCYQNGDLATKAFSNPGIWSKYVQPKKQIKLYQYAYKNTTNAWVRTIHYYKDDQEFIRIIGKVKFRRLDNTEMEVDDESNT